MFEGNQEAFKETYLYSKSDMFQKHPIINLDFGQGYKFITRRDFSIMVKENIIKHAQSHKIIVDDNLPVQELFGKYIEKLRQKSGPVVILIDNFDRITLDSIMYPKKRSDIIDLLTKILAAIKDQEENIRFFMKTNTSLIRYTSYFYEKTQIQDISLDPEFSDMLGFTESEIIKVFGNYLKFYESQSTFSSNRLNEKINDTFGGFRFTSKSSNLYNPKGFLNYLTKGNPDTISINSVLSKFVRDYLQSNFVYGMPTKDFAGNFEILTQEYFKDAHLDK